MKKLIPVLFTFAFAGSFAQNLIINGGFETYKKCPDNQAQLKYATGWQDQNAGNGDYFNACSTNSLVTVPGKHLPAHSGKAYAGFCSIREQYFEFIQTKLLSPLSPEKTYCLELFVNKGPERVLTNNELALLFSKGENKVKDYNFYSDQLIQANNLIIYKLPQNSKEEWVAVRIIYKPKAAEQFLTIGLNKGKEADPNKINQPYYYIDDISLTEMKKGEACSCDQADTATTYNVAIGKPLILKNISFEVNKATLLQDSYSELNKLVAYIKAHQQLKIAISGYTDNVGKEADNLKLSASRAKAVADYLVNQGTALDRVSYKGYGSSKPVADNTTEENRAKNRRVEVIFR